MLRALEGNLLGLLATHRPAQGVCVTEEDEARVALRRRSRLRYIQSVRCIGLLGGRDVDVSWADRNCSPFCRSKG